MNIFILAYYLIHLVRKRLKAATCVQKIKWQISLLQAAPRHCHSEDQKGPIIYCYYYSYKKIMADDYFSKPEPFILKQVNLRICLSVCLCFHPAQLWSRSLQHLMFFTFFAIYELQVISMNKKPILTQMQAQESIANV